MIDINEDSGLTMGRRKVTSELPRRVFSTSEEEQWRHQIADIYVRMRTKARNRPYCVQCDDISVKVLPNVYAPRFFTDSLWFAQELPRVVGNGSLLEIGTGTGIIAIACARAGARVVATDLNPDAAKNARRNVADHRLQIGVREGDVYDPLAADEQFDFIFWAHPFNNWPTPVTDMLMRSGLDYHYDSLRKYITEARHHLTAHGRLLLGTGDSADLRTISALAVENGYRLEILNRTHMPLEEGGTLFIEYLICEFTRA